MKLCRCNYKASDRVEYYTEDHSACRDKDYDEVVECKKVEVKLTLFGYIRYYLIGFIVPTMIKSEREI